MTIYRTIILLFFILSHGFAYSQDVPILNFSLNSSGQAQLEIEGESDKYYLLTTVHQPNFLYESVTSMTLGVDGNMIISEPLAAFPLENYRVTEYSRSEPGDIDGDGLDDLFEYNNMPTHAPLNHGREIPFEDGALALPDESVFSDLAVVSEDVPWAPFLNNQEFVKFAIVNQGTDSPEVYFINSETHFIHANFLNTIDVDQFNDDVVTGEVIYNPNEILSNGVVGSYSFNYSFGNAFSFEVTRRTFELLAASMPFLTNNLQHFIGANSEATHISSFQDDFNGSRVPVVLESEVFSDVDYIPFHEAEGYGFFRVMDLDENPGSRDIVLYETLPNSLPRVGGIITSVVQTPLSHVNLRAIQDNVPNAYIKDPLDNDLIADLVDKYIYFKVEEGQYEIREATLEEVNAWYENLRPTVPQIPERDLTQTRILPLDSIGFDMSSAFGAKCSNVATMRTFGFPDGTIPNGFGVPFYYYDEFMKFNDFYTRAEAMMSDSDFVTDLETRIDMLKDFRKDIKAAEMPDWMFEDLQLMQESFPEGTSIRCRSSTNNEDLPGFSGAGLYTSKTQHPEEGHISKSIKQVYASMWNFRAFDERDFYRVDQFIAAMGVLCHPNFEDEKSNGVGVSIDPIYETDNTYYLNTQVGEALITNPEANEVPEEILLSQDPEEGYIVLRNSNLVPIGELVMDEAYLDSMRVYLTTIHDNFAELYNVVGASGFGMDIEYKVTKEDQLIIKQARPWVSFWADIKAQFDLAVTEISQPVSSATLTSQEAVAVTVSNRGLNDMTDFQLVLMLDGEVMETISVLDLLTPQSQREYLFSENLDLSQVGAYDITVYVVDETDGYATNDTLTTTVQKLHALEGALQAEVLGVGCSEELLVRANVTNLGANIFTSTAIEVEANGSVVDTFLYTLGIPSQASINIDISIIENLMPEENQITLRLVSVNGQTDAIDTNNSASVVSGLESTSDFVTLIIDVDDYPEETTWTISDDDDQIVASGNMDDLVGDVFSEEVCVDVGSCYVLNVFDAVGDGICCDWGIGHFLLVSSSGDTLIYNDGEFGSQSDDEFCLDGAPCTLVVEINTSAATDDLSSDGEIEIAVSGGSGSYTFSIDGGETFLTDSIFTGLQAGIYTVIVTDDSGSCLYDEEVTVDFGTTSVVNIQRSESIRVFPNPTEGEVTVSFMNTELAAQEVRIQLLDIHGRLVTSDSAVKRTDELSTKMSLSGLVPGTYVAKCTSGTFEKFIKIVKIR